MKREDNMPEIDEFETRAEELLKRHSGIIVRCSATRGIAQALREVHDSAVEKCASYCEAYPFDVELEMKCGCIPNTEYANVLRRLKKSNS